MALLLDLLVTGKTRLNDDTYATNIHATNIHATNIYADKFIRTGSSDKYVLLGGGGHRTLNDFSMANHTHSDYLPCLRMRNPSKSNDAPGQGGIPFPLSLKGAGYPVYDDPEFASGTNGVTVYDNTSGGAVTLTRISDNQLSYNSSGYILQISTSTGTASPGRGGFIQEIRAYPNAVYAQIFRAKIPEGFSVVNAENSMGTGYSTHWLTDTAGTGKWEWYIRVTICGEEGLSGNNHYFGGHVYLNGTGAVTWYLSYCNVIDLTEGNYDGLRTKYSDNASHVTVGNNNDDVNYNLVFHSGPTLYSSNGIYCNPNTGYMYSNGLTLKNPGERCLEVYGGISSYKKSGTVLSTVNNENASVLDTIYNHGDGNLSINAPNGNLYLSRNRGKTYIGGTTYYIDRAGNLGSATSRWDTIWADIVETTGLNCTTSAHFNGRWHFVPALTSTSSTSDNNGSDAQIIAGGVSPIVLVKRTGGTVTLPSATVMDTENGAWVILIKMNTAPCTYNAGPNTKFYLCWDGGSQNTKSFTQIQNSYMMFYYNRTWYVTQFTYT